MYQFGREVVRPRRPMYPLKHPKMYPNKAVKKIEYYNTPTDTETEDYTESSWDQTSHPEESLDTYEELTEDQITKSNRIHTTPHSIDQMKKWIKIMFIEHPEDEQIDSLSRGIEKYTNNDIIHLKRLLKGMPVKYDDRRATIASLEKNGIVVLWVIASEKIARVHFNEIEF